MPARYSFYIHILTVLYILNNFSLQLIKHIRHILHCLCRYAV